MIVPSIFRLISPASIKGIIVAFLFATALPLEIMAQAKLVVAANASYSAVSEAVAAAQPGDTVVVPPGQATWTSSLHITKSLYLIGSGAGSTVIKSGISSSGEYLIHYTPASFSTDQPFRISGFTFDLNDSSHGIYLDGTGNTGTVLQTKCRIDHCTFTGVSGGALSPNATHVGWMMGVIDNNTFDNIAYPVRNPWGGGSESTWWNNRNAKILGTSESMYYEDNLFTGVEIFGESGHGNGYVSRYNTVTASAAAYPMLDIHGNQDAAHGNAWSSFGGEVYGNLINSIYGMTLMDHRGGKLLLFMNTRYSSAGDPLCQIQVRDEYADSDNPTTNPEPQYPNDAYYFLNRKNYTGAAPNVVNGGTTDNPPLTGTPKENREYFVGTTSFDGTKGVGWGTLANRPATCTVGVGYWATNQSTTNLSGMVGKNPATPISGTLYVCTATNVWTAFYTPYTYPHPLRNKTLTVTSPNGGETWAVGTSRNITWTSTRDIGNVKIEYSTDNGANFTTITSSTADTWSYAWTLPNVISSSCLVRLSAAGTEPSDTSNSVFRITNAPAVIGLSKTALNFGTEKDGTPTPAAKVMITNTGIGTLHWTAFASTDWISVSPENGTGAGALSIGISRANMSPGTYQGTVMVSDPAAANSPVTIQVNLYVTPEGANAAPFGDFGTPLNGANVFSSIPVTGWALDDIEVKSVKIYRGTGLSDRIFIGDAAFVRGARPDVETAFPTYPQNDRAGWGYMLLTNFLPNGGNGTFQMLAYATDSSNHEVLLGSKTIVVDNLSAVLPFGAIDTPSQDGIASGSSFLNFGWALTPRPKSIPVDGSTITVLVDGEPLGHPLYGYYREDIATMFPDYANSSSAIGFFTLDTTGYADGVHTIAWSVIDSTGAVDGIGSRFFTIQNASNESNAVQMQTAIKPLTEFALIPDDVRTPVSIKLGYKRDILPEIVYPEPDGTIRIRIPEISRIAIFLNGVEESELMTRDSVRDRHRRPAGTAESGTTSPFDVYQLVGDELRPLPIGASFDSEAGILFWQPGPGFIGEFTFIFINNRETGTVKKIVTIKVNC